MGHIPDEGAFFSDSQTMPDILMPALSPTMEEGKLAKWHVKEGDTVRPGDILAEIETDKATMEFEAIDEGKIGKLLVPEGAEGVKINAPIAQLITDDAPAAKAPQPPKPAASPAVQSTPQASPPAEKQKPAVQSGNGHAAPDTEHRVFASPLAKRIAREKGVDLNRVRGSGPRGRIVKVDVEAAMQGAAPAAEIQAPQPAPARSAPEPRAAETAAPSPGLAPLPDAHLFYKDSDYDSAPNDLMRKAIARRLTSAKALISAFLSHNRLRNWRAVAGARQTQ